MNDRESNIMFVRENLAYFISWKLAQVAAENRRLTLPLFQEHYSHISYFYYVYAVIWYHDIIWIGLDI